MSEERYQVIRRLGSGGMADVFLAEQSGPLGFKKRVVLKRLLPSLTSDKQMIEMFLDEARIAAQMRHRNICQILDFGIDDDGHFMALEYLEGKDLQEVVFGLKVPRAQALRICAEIARALAFAHGLKDAGGQPLNLVHRDVSPTNIFLCFDGGVKLLDFGIAKANDRLAKTLAGGIKGKVAYMAPEQLRGNDVTPRTDVFALGVVLFELCSRTPPKVQGAVERLAELEDGSLASAIADSRLPPALKSLVAKATSFDASARFASAEEMEVAIEACARVLDDELTGSDALKFHEQLRELDATVVHNPLSERATATDFAEDDLAEIDSTTEPSLPRRSELETVASPVIAQPTEAQAGDSLAAMFEEPVATEVVPSFSDSELISLEKLTARDTMLFDVVDTEKHEPSPRKNAPSPKQVETRLEPIWKRTPVMLAVAALSGFLMAAGLFYLFGK